jgi:hypothetical protein
MGFSRHGLCVVRTEMPTLQLTGSLSDRASSTRRSRQGPTNGPVSGIPTITRRAKAD